MMCEKQIYELFLKLGVILDKDHFVLASGRHSEKYVNKDVLYSHPEEFDDVCLEISRRFNSCDMDIVIGPVVGGALIAQSVALHSTCCVERSIRAVFSDKVAGKDSYTIKRGYEKLIPGARVLIVEDILTTGGSAAKVVAEVKKLGGIPVGFAAICNRGGVTKKDLGLPEDIRFESLLNLDIETFSEEECPMCKAGVPVNKLIGKGAEYLARKL